MSASKLARSAEWGRKQEIENMPAEDTHRRHACREVAVARYSTPRSRSEAVTPTALANLTSEDKRTGRLGRLAPLGYRRDRSGGAEVDPDTGAEVRPVLS